MNHRVKLKKLSKTPAHRKAMIRNMLIALFRYERIKTTLAKSKVLQRIAERLITRTRVDSVANRRLVAKWVQDKEIHAKLFTSIAPLFVDRKGGYTRIVKLGQRYGDASEMVYISLVSFTKKDDDGTLTSQDNKKKEKLVSKKSKDNLAKSDQKLTNDTTQNSEEKQAESQVVSESNAEKTLSDNSSNTVDGDGEDSSKVE